MAKKIVIKSGSLPDNKASRIVDLENSRTIADQLLALLPSIYSDQSASAYYNLHLRALAKEFSQNHQLFYFILRNLDVNLIDKPFLYQFLGKDLGIKPSAQLTTEEYRDILLLAIFILYGGSHKHTIQEGVESYSIYPVEVVELFRIFDAEARLDSPSFLNSFGDLLNGDSATEDALILNAGSYDPSRMLFNNDRMLWLVDLLILESANPTFIDKGGKLSEVLTKIKPAHTQYLLRNVVQDTISIRNLVEDGGTTIYLGAIGQISGSGLNISSNQLTGPATATDTLFVLNESPVYGFVAATTIVV